MHLIQAHKGRVCALAYSPNGKLLASGGEDKQVCLWNLTTGAETTFRLSHTGCVCALAFSPDGKLLASGGEHSELFLWRTFAGTCTALAGHSEVVAALAFHPHGRTLAAASGNHMRLFWEVENHGRWTTAGVGPGAQALAFDSAGERVAVGSDGQVWLWELAAGTTRLTGAKSLPAGTPVRAVAFSPDGAFVAATADRAVQVWDVRDRTLRHTLRGHADLVWTVAYTRDGQRLLSGSEDGSVRVWDASSGAERTSRDWGVGKVRAVAVAPDGLTAAAAGDRAVAVWDIGE
jgi:WD40 repeat protein